MAGLWALVALAGLIGYYAWDLPDLSALEALEGAPSVTVLDRHGERIGGRGAEVAGIASAAALPSQITDAVLAIEDRRFHSHYGIDPVGILRAVVANIRAGAIVQGGSTITQQLAKNVFLTPERSLRRKVQEMLLAFILEARLTKDEILTLYLNRVYLGAGTWGIRAASMRYFGREPDQLTLMEAAMLAGLLKAPSRYSPASDPDAAMARAGRVLEAMVEAGFLTAGEAAAARRSEIVILEPTAPGSERYFLDWVMDALPGFVGDAPPGLVVETTLDPRLQAAAAEAIAAEFREPGGPQAALVALGPEGDVRAMVGGRNWRTSPFNRAADALRQPGSAFKPFVYLAAFERGWVPSDTILDAPVAIGDWRPGNFSETYRGEIALSTAFSRSVNTATVRLSEAAGRENVAAAARRLGVAGDIEPVPSIALGTASVRLVDMTAAYATFANGGSGVFAFGIARILDARGRVLYARSGSGLGRIVAREHVAMMNTMFAETISDGTGRIADIGRPAGGKTGTSQDFRDAWFVGFTADLVAGVWIGNDDATPMEGVTGGGAPARIWRDFMDTAHRGVQVAALPGTGEAPREREERDGGLVTRLLRSLGIID